jgi:DNA-binding NarL/FixJ family response regulator
MAPQSGSVKKTSPWVLIVEDHPLISISLQDIVKEGAKQVRVRIASNLTDAIELVKQDPPVMIIMDLMLPDSDRIDIIESLELFKESQIFLTSGDEELLARTVARAPLHIPVKSFPKSLGYLETIDLIRRALVEQAGTDAVGPNEFSAVIKTHVAQTSIGIGGNKKPLTAKQVEIIEQIEAGLTNKEIARVINLSVETVKDHVREILYRLEAKTRTEAIAVYRQALRRARFSDTTGTDGKS